MSAWGGAADTSKKHTRTRAPRIFFSAWVLCLGACTGTFDADPLLEYTTRLLIAGIDPHTVTRHPEAGIYLLEVRARDTHLRMRVDAGTSHTGLADAFRRHGPHRTVVRLTKPARLTMAPGSVAMRGEGAPGPACGFPANGSNAVVASQWPVDVALAARFMETFHGAFRASGNAADAPPVGSSFV